MSENDIKVGQLGVRYLIDGSQTSTMGMFELTVPPAANVPPPHSHTNDEEIGYVLEGALQDGVDYDTRDLGPGQTVHTARGAVHGFSTPLGSSARALIILSTDIGTRYARDVAAVASAGGPPDKASLIAVMSRYGLVPPAPSGK